MSDNQRTKQNIAASSDVGPKPSAQTPPQENGAQRACAFTVTQGYSNERVNPNRQDCETHTNTTIIYKTLVTLYNKVSVINKLN